MNWANVVRILKQNLQNLGGTIGTIAINAFKPFLISLNNLIIKLNEFAKVVAASLGKIFGWKYEEGKGSTLADIEEDASGVSDGLDDATSSAKKLKNQLQGFDQLNVLTRNDSSSGSGSGSGSSASGGNSGQEGQWTKTDSMLKEYESSLDSLEKLGDAISKKLTKALENINWNKVYKSAENFGKGLADFLNGLIKPEMFGAMGSTIGEAINTAIDGSLEFVEKFNWENFGDSIASFVGNAIDNINWNKGIDLAGSIGEGIAKAINAFVSSDSEPIKKIGTAAANLVKAGVKFWYKFVTTLDFPKLGEKIGEGINAFFKGLNEKDKETGLTGWEMLGLDISKTFDGITKALTKALEEIEFDEVGQGIVDCISKLDWLTFTWDLATLADTVGKKFIEAVGGVAWQINFDIWEYLGVDKETLTKSYETWKKDFDTFWKKCSPLALIKRSFNPDDWPITKITWSDIIDKLFNFDTTIDLTEAVDVFFKKAKEAFKEKDFLAVGENILAGILAGLVSAMSAITEPFTDLFTWVWNGICNIFGIHSPAEEMKPLGNNILLGLVEGFKAKFDEFKTAVQELPSKIIEWFGNVALSIGVTVQEAATTALNTFKATWDSLKSKAVELVATAKEAVKGALDKISNAWGEIKSKAPELVAKAKEKVEGALASLSTLWNGIKSKASTLTSKVKESVQGALASLKNTWDSIKSKASTLTGKAKNGSVAIFNTLIKNWDKLSDKTSTLTAKFKDMFSAAFKKMVNGLIRGINGMITTLNKIPGVSITPLDEMKAKGGVYSNGMWHNIRQYANGTPTLGMPTMGSLFIAGEAGAEIVANSSKGTEVLNESQIAQSIAIGVQNANNYQNNLIAQQNALLSKQNELLVGIYEKSGISSDDIFSSVRKADRNYKSINGHSAFVY